MSDDDLLGEALRIGDARFLLDKAITSLLVGTLDARLADWLSCCLERIQNGEDARKVFDLTNSEGAPKQIHGAGRFQTMQIAAALELATRRFPTKTDAEGAVAEACRLDSSSIRRARLNANSDMPRQSGEKPPPLDLSSHDDELLKDMAGAELLRRIKWPS